LWDLKSKPLPRANAPPNNIEPHLDYSDSQLPPPARNAAQREKEDLKTRKKVENQKALNLHCLRFGTRPEEKKMP
jgi:hypothetical protein